MTLAAPRVVPEDTQQKKDIYTFDYSIRVLNNHSGSTSTLPVEKPFSHKKGSLKSSQGEGCLGYPRPLRRKELV